MEKSKIYPVIQAVLAAILFGVSAPLSKMLLGNIEPVPLASFLYLGSGAGLFLYQVIKYAVSKEKLKEASLKKKDVPWLLGSIIFGGVAAPIILMISLVRTPASTASLLLNFEGVATALIALLLFKENIGKSVGAAIVLITISSIILTWDLRNQWGFSIGAAGIIAACVCWGVDNNFTKKISFKNPFAIVTIKGFSAGLFSLVLSFLIKNQFPSYTIIFGAMLLGFFSYGLSIVLFVLAMRSLGSARTSALFGTAPFIGAILSFILYKELPDLIFLIALPVMILGTVFLLKEKHNHMHFHEHLIHEHKHTHDDGHHNHIHDNEISLPHSHIHEHKAIEHEHPHTPDIHHNH